VWLRDTHGAEMVFWLVASVVVTDIGAYFVGKKFGKRKLVPSISPNKTWEGAGGGLLCALVVGALFGNIFGSLVISVLSMAGDLLESKIKRIFGVKDSGNLIPGHGGILDRVDGFLLAAPAAALMLYAW
jgi:phosphatidate cytidylyltransferase